jgi:hypothetical protein
MKILKLHQSYHLQTKMILLSGKYHGRSNDMSKEEKEALKYIAKEYITWIIMWAVMIYLYVFMGLRFDIIEPRGYMFVFVGLIMGACIAITNVKVKSALLLLNRTIFESEEDEKNIK